jgi:outer membrane murein-binding lipoprotein Lpp
MYCSACLLLMLSFCSTPQIDKLSADATELKAGYDKLAVDTSEQRAQLDKASADAAEFKAGYDKLMVDTSEQKAQVGGPGDAEGCDGDWCVALSVSVALFAQ